MVRWILIFGLFLLIGACDTAEFSVLDNKIVVELTLVANEPVPDARVSSIAAADQRNQFPDVAISNAEVILTTGTTSLRLEPSKMTPGVYTYLGPEHLIQPSTRYDLRVSVPGQANEITGTTNVPSTLEILTASRTSGTYLSDEQLVLKVTPGRSADQSQSSFTLVTEALEVRRDLAVPTVIGFLDNDSDLDLEEFRISGSPIIAEGNFVSFPDGTIQLIYPWIGVSFYGSNIIYVNALDENLAGFIRSAELQQGGNGTFGPGVIPNVLPSLSGAHGLFGSLSRDTISFMVKPPENNRATRHSWFSE